MKIHTRLILSFGATLSLLVFIASASVVHADRDLGYRCPDEPVGAPLYSNFNVCMNSPCPSQCVFIDNTDVGVRRSVDNLGGSVDNVGGSGENITLMNPLGSGTTNLEDFLLDILDFVVRIGTIAVILSMIFIGFKYVTVARSNPGKISEVHSMLLWTIVGALILLGAKAIALGIQATVQALSV